MGPRTPQLSHSLVPQDLPGSLDVRVQVLLGRPAAAHSITRVIVREHVAVDSGAEADVKTAHLAQVHGVPVRKQQCVAAVGGTADKHAADPVSPAASGAQHLHCIELPLGILPVRPLRQVQARHPVSIRVHGVRGLRREERQLSSDATGTGRATEEPAEFAQRKAIHPGALLGHLAAVSR